MKIFYNSSRPKSCHSKVVNWLKPFGTIARPFLVFVFAFIYYSDLFAQPIIDGNPGEWPAILNNPANSKKAFKHDPFQMNGVDDQWTGGSQDGDFYPATDWHWVNGNSNDKGDIANAGAVIIGTRLYFFGDRAAVNGDAQIGFWFFLGGIQQFGTGAKSSNNGFIGEHVNGDLLVISNFTGGGGNANPTVYEWQGKSGNSPGGPVIVNNADAKLATNSTVYNVPGGTMYNGQVWSFSPKSGTANTYPVPLFFEGYVDLGSIQGASLCFTSFLLETRNSQSIGASLQDLVAGSFSGVPDPPTVQGDEKCFGFAATATANCKTGSATRWYDVPTGGNPIASNVTSLTLPAGTAAGTYDYYVSCIDGVCESSRSKVTIKINPTPVVDGVVTEGENDNAIDDGVTKLADDLYQIRITRTKVAHVAATPSGGSGSYSSITWVALDADAATSFVPNGASGTFTVLSIIGLNTSTGYRFKVTLVDSKGCTSEDIVTIVPVGTAEPCAVNGPGITCAGSNNNTYTYFDGNSTLNTDFDYTWSISGNGTINGAPKVNVTSVVVTAGAGAGSYTVTMTITSKYTPELIPAVQCSKTTAVNLIALSLVKTDVTCFGGSNGTVTATFSGGTSPYEASIDGGAFAAATSPKTFTGLSAGSHTVAVRDANNCGASMSITVGQAPALQLSLGKADVTCFGGSNGTVTATFSGGSGAFQANIDGGAFAAATSPKTFTGLSAGSHTVVIRDAADNNCTKTLSITVGEPPALQLSLGKADVTCNGGSNGSVTATFSGGSGAFQANIDGGAFAAATSPKTFTGLSAGSHTVVIRDAADNNCTKTLSITVGEPPALQLSLGKADVTCNGGSNGSVTATFSGGSGAFQANIDGGAFAAATSPKTFTGLSAGSHTVVIRDAADNSCTKTLSITVGEPPALQLSLGKSDVTCNGGSNGTVTATFSGGSGAFQANIDGGAFAAATSPKTFTGLSAGSHTVVIRDAADNNCTKTLSITVGEPPALQLSLDKTDLTCTSANSGSITASFSGGSGSYEANIDGGAFAAAVSPVTFTGLSGGAHTVTVRDANDNNCTSSKSITVGPPTACAHIFPTATTCCNYLVGNPTDFQLQNVCLTVLNNKVSNAIPGVFFYYGDYTPSVSGPTTIVVKQTWDPSNRLGPFAPQNLANIRLFVDNCQSVAVTTSIGNGPNSGNATLSFNAVAGKKYIISVKYDVKSIIGTNAPNGAAIYTFAMYVNGSATPAVNSTGQVTAVANCTDNTPAPTGDCPSSAAPITQTSVRDVQPAHAQEISLKAYPNPYSSVVNFRFVSPETGKAMLELFDISGRKLGIVYQGNVQANMPVNARYNVPPLHRVPLFYRLTVNDKSVKGNILPDGN